MEKDYLAGMNNYSLPALPLKWTNGIVNRINMVREAGIGGG